MGPEPTHDEIMSALQDSGYLMEQHVASDLERLGFHVQTNFPFEDPDEGKSREIDVRAIKRVGFNEAAKISAYVELIVECKNTSNSFVFITRPKNDSDINSAPPSLIFPYEYSMHKDLGGGRGWSKSVDAFLHLGFDRVHYDQQMPSKAVQFCRIDRKGGSWHANHGGLYDAIFYPMAKALVARRAELPKARNTEDWRYLWFLCPVVVTAGPLLTVDSTAPSPEPSAEDHVTFRRDLRSGKLSGSYALEFVRQDRLRSFVERVIDPVAALAAELAENKSDFLSQTRLPWVD